MEELKLKHESGYWRGSFSAMASPCELLMEVETEILADRILNVLSAEAKRIEKKFSRYLDGNIIHKINNAAGKSIAVDEETARLIDFANTLYQLSDHLFDVTSGVLRKVWVFDGSDNLPESNAVKKVLAKVGWGKVEWQNNTLAMPAGMEIDLGGIGKEYAVDRCVQLARELTDASVLINFGGDLATTCERRNEASWSVGRLITGQDQSVMYFQLLKGAIATSGDAHRYLMKDGVRYSHVLNPLTGWPVEDAPHTVSVAADTCVEAGMMSTFAMLHGEHAEDFLKRQNNVYWLN